MRQRSSGFDGRGNERRLRDLPFGRTVGTGLPGMGVDAVSALRGERDAERDQLAVFPRNDPVLTFHGMMERHERTTLLRRKAEEIGNAGQVFTALVLAHGKLPLCSAAMTDRGRGNGKRFAALRTFLKLSVDRRWRQSAASTHHALAVFPIRLAQFALEDLPRTGQRQRG